MTIYRKRRGRRSLAAIVAAMLMASVLAVVAGSPAQAANTAGEALVDHDNNASTDKVREFGGRDRYDTSNRLATNFGKARGLGNVSTAFVASGLKLVDAISVAGLAGFLDAPVLLTPPDSLNGGVADFIEDYGVQTVYVLGGPVAVADSVEEAIEALANKPTVTRLAGTDRYATAAAVASQLGGGASWCGGSEAAAFLANGGDVSLAYAMAASPVANRLQLPLLLTASDALPSATEEFITDQDIEHVVIMGGESSVSDDVSAALTSAGVNTVTRIDGDSPADASAALAKLVTNGCKADLGLVSADHVALVAESGLPDGVAASPVLAGTYDANDGELVPMLVVTDELPASVRDYLAATPKSGSSGKLHLDIVAVGGDKAVTPEVMTAAVAAAMSADPLTVSITSATPVPGSSPVEYKPPQADDTTVVLRFSDNVTGAAWPAGTATPPAAWTALSNLVRDNLEIDGVPAQLASAAAAGSNPSTPVSYGDGGDTCTPDAVTVTFAPGFKLEAGDVISLAGGAKFGAANDARTVAGVSVTVPAVAADTTPPVVNVIAIDGATDVAIVKFDNSPAAKLGTETGHATIEKSEIVVTSTETKTVGTVRVDAQNVGVSGSTIALADNKAFAVGDRITIKSGALVDQEGNKSRARTFSVIAAQKSPRITSVTMSSLSHTASASVDLPAGIAPPQPPGNDGVPIKISAKKGGAADGAVGNGWKISFDKATSWKSDAKAAVDIGVRVNSRDRLVSVRFDAGDADFGDLKAALEANSAFDALFKVTLPGGCDATATDTVALGIGALVRGATVNTVTTVGGKTAVAVEVRFNAYVRQIDALNELADDVFKAAAERYNKTSATDLALDNLGPLLANTASDTDVSAGTRFEANLVNNEDGGAGTGTALLAELAGPVNFARYEMETRNARLLPMARDLVTTLAGHHGAETAITGPPKYAKIDPVAHVALGYAADDDAGEPPDDNAADLVDENENGGSQVRIGQSSNVKAPDFE